MFFPNVIFLKQHFFATLTLYWFPLTSTDSLLTIYWLSTDLAETISEWVTEWLLEKIAHLKSIYWLFPCKCLLLWLNKHLNRIQHSEMTLEVWWWSWFVQPSNWKKTRFTFWDAFDALLYVHVQYIPLFQILRIYANKHRFLLHWQWHWHIVLDRWSLISNPWSSSIPSSSSPP